MESLLAVTKEHDMKDLFKAILIEPFQENWWLSWVIGILMWLLAVIVAGFILWFTIWAVDSWFMPTKEKDGIITNKYMVPAHTYTTYVHVGKVMVPQFHSVPDSYEVEIEIDGLKDDISLDLTTWENLHVNQKVFCKYTSGRILNSMYLESFDYYED